MRLSGARSGSNRTEPELRAVAVSRAATAAHLFGLHRRDRVVGPCRSVGTARLGHVGPAAAALPTQGRGCRVLNQVDRADSARDQIGGDADDDTEALPPSLQRDHQHNAAAEPICRLQRHRPRAAQILRWAGTSSSTRETI